MLKPRQSFPRVMYYGEIYFVVADGHRIVPNPHNEGEVLKIPTVYLTKVETASHLKTPIKVIEALPFEFVPMVSEIQEWLFSGFPLDNL